MPLFIFADIIDRFDHKIRMFEPSLFTWIMFCIAAFIVSIIDFNMHNDDLNKNDNDKVTDADDIDMVRGGGYKHIAVSIFRALLFPISIGVSLAMYLFTISPKLSIDFVTTWFLETSLSIDNLFVFIVIFKSLDIKEAAQRKVLLWGVFGAVFFRLTFILFGIKIVKLFDPIMYFFALLLIYTGIKTIIHTRCDATSGDINVYQSKDMKSSTNNWLIRILQKFIKIDMHSQQETLIIKKDNNFTLTQYGVAIILIELSDIMFAIDSVPAAFSITLEPFIVFAGNIIAILGLRSLYMLLAKAIYKAPFIHITIACILLFTGSKIVFEQLGVHIPNLLSILIIMTCCVVPYFVFKKQ